MCPDASRCLSGQLSNASGYAEVCQQIGLAAPDPEGTVGRSLHKPTHVPADTFLLLSTARLPLFLTCIVPSLCCPLLISSCFSFPLVLSVLSQSVLLNLYFFLLTISLFYFLSLSLSLSLSILFILYFTLSSLFTPLFFHLSICCRHSKKHLRPGRLGFPWRQAY